MQLYNNVAAIIMSPIQGFLEKDVLTVIIVSCLQGFLEQGVFGCKCGVGVKLRMIITFKACLCQQSHAVAIKLSAIDAFVYEALCPNNSAVAIRISIIYAWAKKP